MASPRARRRRPLLYLLVAGFVVGVVWLTRTAWRPLRTRGTATAVRGTPTPLSVVPPVPAPPRPASPVSAPPAPAPAAPAPSTPGQPGTILDGGPGGSTPGVQPPDDLTRIEGIGRRMAAALVSEGISTFQALGVATPMQVRAALGNQGLRFAPSLLTWPEQARLLADGDEAGFAELSARLRRGTSAAT